MASRKKKPEKTPEAPAQEQAEQPTEATAEPSKSEAPASEKKEAAGRQPKVERFTRNIKTKLTKEELQDRGEQSANLTYERDREVEALSSYNKDIKAKIATKDMLIRDISNEIRSKHTYRDVECERIFLYSEGVVKEVRLDTGEEIDIRQMQAHERQQDLFQEDADLEDEFNDDEPEDPDSDGGAEPADAADDDSDDEFDE